MSRTTENVVAYATQQQGNWSGGTTRQIYSFPAGTELRTGNSQFWAGTATIERAAEYSFFPSTARIHMPIDGNGLRLCFDQPIESVTLRTGEQFRFPGTRSVRAELLDGPVVAFNLIFHAAVDARATFLHLGEQAVCLASVWSEHAALALDTQRVCVLYGVAGTSAVGGMGYNETTLCAGDAIVFHTTVGAEPHTNPTLRSIDDASTLVVADAYWV